MPNSKINPRIAVAFGAALLIGLVATSAHRAEAAEATNCAVNCMNEYGFQFLGNDGYTYRYDYCTNNSTTGAIICYYDRV